MLTKMFEDPELLAGLLKDAKNPKTKASMLLKSYNILMDFLEPSTAAFRVVRPELVRGEPVVETTTVTEDPDFLMGTRSSFSLTPEKQEEMRRAFEEQYVTPDAAEENVKEMLKKAREFIDSRGPVYPRGPKEHFRQQSSLQSTPEAGPPTTLREQAVPSGVQTASVDPARTTGGISTLASGKVDVAKARQLFDSPGEITFAARGGAIHSGIGAFR